MTVLLVTEKSDLAADLVVLALRRQGIEFLRFNSDTVPGDGTAYWNTLSRSGGITVRGKTSDIASIHAAWFRRFRPASSDYIEREANIFIAGICHLLEGIYWMNEPQAVQRAESKMFQLHVAALCGLGVPHTVIGNDVDAARAELDGPMVLAKALGGARITDEDQDFHIFSQAVEWNSIGDQSVRAAPLILQQLVKPGTDVRITFVGDQFFAAAIDLNDPDAPIDWRASSDENVSYRKIDVPTSVIAGCLKMNHYLGLEYAAYDFVAQADGTYWFLELNPSGQWGWIEQATGFAISDQIATQLRRERGCFSRSTRHGLQ